MFQPLYLGCSNMEQHIHRIIQTYFWKMCGDHPIWLTYNPNGSTRRMGRLKPVSASESLTCFLIKPWLKKKHGFRFRCSERKHLEFCIANWQCQVVKEELRDTLQLHTKMLQEQRLLLDNLRPVDVGKVLKPEKQDM